MKRRIVWASQHLEIDTMTGKFKEISCDCNTHSEYDDDPDELHGEKIQNVISTPFGFWRIDDIMNPYKQFKLWMGHTNFTINAKVAQIIKSTPGVEVLTILTRYRFLIGVGELFNIRDVRTSIEKSLKCNVEVANLITNVNIKQQIEDLKTKLLATKDRWAIYVFPNGKIDFITDANGTTQYNERLLLYKHAVDHSTGILIENEHE